MEPTATTPPLDSPQSSSSPASAAVRRVLVVEDERGTRDAMEALLLRAGWTPVLVPDAASADEAVAGCPGCFHAAVIDVHLPDGDGIALARRVRDIIGKAARVVVLSGDHSPKTLARLSDAGVDRFIGKPLSFQALVHALDNVDDGIEDQTSEHGEHNDAA